MSISLTKISLTVGAIGFLAYCVYFDRKRRSDPEFRAKLKKKRALAKRSLNTPNIFDIPLSPNPAQNQAYFLQEIQLSDELMLDSKFEEAAIHLAKATVVCSQKAEFLAVMQKTLPPQIFQLLLVYYQQANEWYENKKKTMDSKIIEILKPESQFNDTDIE